MGIEVKNIMYGIVSDRSNKRELLGYVPLSLPGSTTVDTGQR